MDINTGEEKRSTLPTDSKKLEEQVKAKDSVIRNLQKQVEQLKQEAQGNSPEIQRLEYEVENYKAQVDTLIAVIQYILGGLTDDQQ